VSQSLNGQSSEGNRPKSRGTYTGERLKLLRPDKYREVVRLLAEPREHVCYREICRTCHVTDDTVKAVEQREAIPIATLKQELVAQAARIAQRAADRVEDEIGDAPLPQAVVTFGVMTDKIVALSNDPTQIHVSHQVSQTHDLGRDLYRRLNELAERLTPKPRTIDAHAEPPAALPALPNGETISDLGR